MVPKLTLFTALVFATYPAHALDLKKELERLRGGADAKETQTHATSADAVGRAAPAAAASLRRAAFLDASRVAPPLTRLGAIVKPRVNKTRSAFTNSLVASQVKPKDPYAFECNPFKHKKCFGGQRQCRNGKKVFDDIRPCDDGEFLRFSRPTTTTSSTTTSTRSSAATEIGATSPPAYSGLRTSPFLGAYPLRGTNPALNTNCSCPRWTRGSP